MFIALLPRALYVHAWREARQQLLGSRFTAEPLIEISHSNQRLNGSQMSTEQLFKKNVLVQMKKMQSECIILLLTIVK
jgi:hypothetical protein